MPDAKFLEWQRDASSILLSSGTVHTGDIVLISSVVAHLMTPSHTVLCFYSRHSTSQRNVNELTRNLAREAVKVPQSSAPLLQLFASCDCGAVQPSIMQLQTSLFSMVEGISVVRFLDALEQYAELGDLLA